MKKALVIGIGGAGTNNITRLNSRKYKLYAINCEERVLKLKNIKATYAPLTALKDLETNKGLAKKVWQNLDGLVKESKEVFLVAGLGSNYSFEVINYIKKRIDKPKHMICFFPFNLEKSRRIKASIDLTEMIGEFDSILVYDNNYLVKKCPKKRMNEAFELLDKKVEQYIENTIN